MGIFQPINAGGEVFGNYALNNNNPRMLDDNNTSSYIDLYPPSFFTGAGNMYMTHTAVQTSDIPAGRRIIAVRLVHRFGQPNSNYRGWPYSYLRQSGARLAASEILAPDGYQAGVYRTQTGPWTTKSGNAPWTIAEVNTMDMYSTIVPEGYGGISSGDRDTRLTELYMQVLYEEPFTTAPTTPQPGNAGTTSTSNPPITYNLAAPQDGQAVRLVIEVARDNAFTTEKKTLVSGYSNATGAGATVTYNGQADLGPGVWYMRAKGQDLLGTETGWSTTSTFTVAHAALPVPVNTGPAPGAIVVNPLSVRSARVDTAASDSRRVGVEFQYAASNTFGTILVSKTVSAADGVATTGTVAYDPGTDLAQKWPQGAIYVRTRTVDKWNQTSAWSATDSFTVQHQPVAQNVSPTNNAVIDQTVTPVRWTFGDPWNLDAPTAYRIRAYLEDNTEVYDSGKITSTALQHILAIPTAHLYQRIRYTVALWDTDDVTSSQLASYYFTFSNSPQITMSFPSADEAIATGQPTFQWNPGINRPGATQRSYELKVYNRNTGNLIYTSGVVNSASARSHTPPQTILSNGGSYQLTLRIVDSDGLNSTLIRNFTASYQAPPQVVLEVDPSPALKQGYVQLNWGMTVPDDYFIEWHVYRREEGDTDWDLVTVIDDSSTTEYHDWSVPKVGRFQYSVTQVADRFGFVLESAPHETAESYYVRSEDFWLIDPEDEANNIRLYSVSGNPYKSEYERTSYVVKNRGKKVNIGTRIGISGTMTCKIRPNSGYSPTELINQIEALQARRHAVCLRDPFGRQFKMMIGDIDVDPLAGTGPDEFADLSIPYEEVY